MTEMFAKSADFLSKGGPVMYFLLLCSVALFTVAIERLLFMGILAPGRRGLMQQVIGFLLEDQTEKALELCRLSRNVIAPVIEAGLVRKGKSKADLEDALRLAIAEERGHMERNLPIIGTIAVISPFVGLFGTVMGIIRAFHDIAEKKTAGPDVVARGVSEALVATAAGLFVAIAAVAIFNFFKARVKQTTLEMQLAAGDLVEQLATSPPKKQTQPASVMEESRSV
ncbi:MAG: MotA/TolQ/ExbB proton channel family protein [Armatimonadetes bacterium]|nr:MotA/TolQ/ExbB proton channel family protein [Armatimonadota bacterium]